MAVSTGDSFRKHNHVVITDSEAPGAYPLSLLTYVMMREFYYTNGDEKGCNRVSEMVKVHYFFYLLSSLQFWNWNWNDIGAIDIAKSSGWIPISGKLLTDSATALNLIHCAGVQVLSEIEAQENKLSFYGSERYIFLKGLGFSEYFDLSKVGTIVFLVFFIFLGLGKF